MGVDIAKMKEDLIKFVDTMKSEDVRAKVLAKLMEAMAPNEAGSMSEDELMKLLTSKMAPPAAPAGDKKPEGAAAAMPAAEEKKAAGACAPEEKKPEMMSTEVTKAISEINSNVLALNNKIDEMRKAAVASAQSSTSQPAKETAGVEKTAWPAFVGAK